MLISRISFRHVLFFRSSRCGPNILRRALPATQRLEKVLVKDFKRYVTKVTQRVVEYAQSVAREARDLAGRLFQALK